MVPAVELSGRAIRDLRRTGPGPERKRIPAALEALADGAEPRRQSPARLLTLAPAAGKRLPGAVPSAPRAARSATQPAAAAGRGRIQLVGGAGRAPARA